MPEYTLPEFTRSLRALAVPSAPGSDHDRIFAPLLQARTAAHRVSGVEGQIAAFDAARLRRGWEEAITALAAARHPRSAADRRALAAELGDLAAPLWKALEALSAAADRLRLASEAERRPQWDRWVAQVQLVFNAADDWWGAALPVLADSRGSGGRFWRRVLRRGVGIALLLGASSLQLHAQHVNLRLPGASAERLRAQGFDVVAVEREAVIVVAGPEDRARLDRLGIRGEVLLPEGADPRLGQGIAFQTVPVVYRPYDHPTRGVRFFLDSLARANPRVTLDTIGVSTQGRPIIVAKLGGREDSPARPNVLFMATYHAREWAATETSLRLLKYLATTNDPRIDSLRATRDIWILPVANPDGYQYTFEFNRLWRKTRSQQAFGAIGVDMNRNHRTNWGLDNAGSSDEPLSEIFRGPSPASEPETQAIERFHVQHPPVLSVSYHTFAGLLLFPPGARYGELPADLGVYRTLAGTNTDPAMRDRVVGSSRTNYAPSPAWNLYTTNGEYNDWASTTFGTISFTPELTSGYDNGRYYGFVFPDDEVRIERVFQDALPFALEVIEAARDPLGFRSANTGIPNAPITLESVSPEIWVRVPAAAAAATTIRDDVAPRTVRVDSTNGGRYTRRLISSQAGRPKEIRLEGGATAAWTVLAINGAELSDASWLAGGFTRDSLRRVAGGFSWRSELGELRSPTIRVPATSDTISIVFRTRYAGDAFLPTPFATVRISTDDGLTWRELLRFTGSAPLFYPEQVAVGGMRGKSVRVSISTSGMDLWLDEVAVVMHGVVEPPAPGTVLALRPSENPVRGNSVRIPTPFVDAAAELFAYDAGGRLLWKGRAEVGNPAEWDLVAERVPNGTYLLIARDGSRTVRLRLFVARR